MLEILFRFTITLFMAIIFGLQRQRSHKPIGFGTYIFVAVGSCGLAIAAVQLNPENPLPLLGAIITGIGFLGAGALIKTSDKIFGFTSAASIWLFAILGLLLGTGYYFLAITTYVIVWLVTLIDNYLEVMSIGSYQRKLTLKLNQTLDSKKLAETLGLSHFKIVSVESDKKDITLSLLVEGSRKAINTIPKNLTSKAHVVSFKIE